MPALLPVTCHQGHYCFAHRTLALRPSRPFDYPLYTGCSLPEQLNRVPPTKVAVFSSYNRPTKPRHPGLNQTAMKGIHKRDAWRQRGSTYQGRDLGNLSHLGCSKAGVQGGTHQAHHPTFAITQELSSSPGPCSSSSNPFPPPMLLQSS